MFYIAKPPNSLQWFLLANVGFTMIIGQVLFLLAIKVSQASLITPYIYSTIIFIVMLDWIILQKNPGLWSILGASLIICAGAYIAYRANAHSS